MLVTTIDAQWEGIGDVGSARYEQALLPPCPTIRVLKGHSASESGFFRALSAFGSSPNDTMHTN